MKTKSLGLVTLRASAIGGFALSVLFIPTGQPIKQTGVIVAYNAPVQFGFWGWRLRRRRFHYS